MALFFRINQACCHQLLTQDAELGITLLHKKIHHILEQQNRRLLDIQLVQAEMLRHLGGQSVSPTRSDAAF